MASGGVLKLFSAIVFVSPQSPTAVYVNDHAGGPLAGVLVSAECAGEAHGAATASTNVAGAARLTLAPGKCRVRASTDAATSWSMPVPIPGEPVRLELLPAGQVTGLPAWPDGTVGPATITVRLTPSLNPRSWLAKAREDVLACPLTDGRWTCIVPASTDLDLELRPDGFAPHYVRGVRVAPGARQDVGIQRVFRGASIAGWIIDGLDEAAILRGRVEAVAGPRPASKSQPLKVVESDRHGFFQLGPLEPGPYQLRARAERGMSLSTPVQVEAGKETKVPTPLAVRPVAMLGIEVSPPEDPDAKPWQVRLIGRRSPRTATIEVDEAVGVDGRWSKDQLPTGPYTLTIHRPDGSTWYRERFELGPGGRELDVAPGQMRVTGSIRLGGEPLATDLRIRDRTTGLEAQLRSDSDGAFEAWMPRLDVSSALWSIRIRNRASALNVSYEGIVPERALSDEVHFAIKVPNRALEGTVTDERRVPQQATVLAQNLGEADAEAFPSTFPAQTVSDGETGKFALRGLSPGKYALYALVPTEEVGVSIQSEILTVTLKPEGAAEKASLVLKRTHGIEGRVRAPDGAGMPGATIFAIATEAPFVPVPLVRTDADGHFVTSVPKTASSVDLLIEAIGSGRRATRQAVVPGRPVDLLLDPGSSGTLFIAADSRSDNPNVVVFHEGVSDDWDSLARWAQWHDSVAAGGELRAPLMAPGVYRACRAGSMRDDIEASVGKLPDRCVEGYLPPGSELRLFVPPSTK